MQKHIRVYRVTPLPDVGMLEFETSVTDQVQPAVNMNPTRGGRLTESSWLREANTGRMDRYLWIVKWEGTSAKWVELQLEEAIRKLDSVGMRMAEMYFTPLG
jgi:hypothetical protein